MQVKELVEGLAGAIAKSMLKPQQLELPFDQALAKTAGQQAVKPPGKAVEYWGYLPGETATSRPFWRKTFATDAEAEAWIKSRNATPMGSNPVNEACWKGYKQLGMKKKGRRQVPNCVPK